MTKLWFLALLFSPVRAQIWTGHDNRRELAECDEILATWNASEVETVVSASIDANFPQEFGATAKLLLLSAISYGVQIRKLCAKCSDTTTSAEEAYEEFCSPNDYGANVTHSGLLLVPLDPDNTMLDGTHVGGIGCHGTTTANDVPSTVFRGEDSPLDILLNVVVASNGTVVLLPDYMGYGESSGIVSKGYIVKKSYITSVVPLWLKAQETVRDESDCATALADSVKVVGYSEGGYAAVSIAHAMHQLGVDVLKVDAGGGPYRVGSVAVLRAVEGVDNGTFPVEGRHYFGLLGAAYSSTYGDVANFGQEQDMLNEDYRDTIVDLVDRSASYSEILEAIPEDDMLSIFNPALLDFVRQAILDGDPDPCANPIQDLNDKICQALKDSDLTEILENTPFPVSLCHGVDDEVVHVDNMRTLNDSNPLLTKVEVDGSHGEAGGTCILQFYLGLLGAEDQIADKHLVGGCNDSSTVETSSSGNRMLLWTCLLSCGITMLAFQ